MGKYSKKLLSRVQEHQVKKILDKTDNLDEIHDELERIGLGDYVHRRTKETNGASP